MPRQTLVWMRPISRPPLWPDENIWNQFRRHECIALAYLCRQVEGERNGQKPVGLIVGVLRLSGFALSQGSDAGRVGRWRGGGKTRSRRLPVSSDPPPNRACGSPAHGSPPDRHPPAGQAPVRERSLLNGWISLVSTHPAVLLPACDPAARPSLGPGCVVPTLPTVLCPAPTPSGSGPNAAKAAPPLTDPGGSLQFPNGLCLPSTASTPEGSWRLHFPGLHRFHGLRRLEPGSAPSGPPVSRRVSNDAAAFASRCGLQGCSPS